MNGADFPRLTAANHRLTSPATPDYNCIAWTAEDTEHWWQPGVYWPVEDARTSFGIEALISAMTACGYQACHSPQLEPGLQKIALYGDQSFYTHASRQLPSGKWTSKLGQAEDIEHDAPEDVAGGVYGEVMLYMQRPIVY